MKVFLLAALLTLASPQAAEDTATIEGRVLRAGSQDPIPNVQIALIKSSRGAALTAETVAALDSIQQLVSSAPRGISRAYLDSVIASREHSLGLPPGTYAQAAASQTTPLTDAEGRFSFKDQAPGTYGIRAALDGYFGPAVNGSASPTVTESVTLEANRRLPPTDIFMVKGGVITGRVRDPNGQPVSGVDVAATRISYSNGRPQWTTDVSRPTDDRGGFRIFWVSPGEYLVGVRLRDATATQDSWTSAFYPGVTDPTVATPLHIKDGSEISGIDFSRPAITPTSTYKIRGTATNPLAAPNPTTGIVDRLANSFMLVAREPGSPDYGNPNPPTLQNSLPSLARPNGEFELPNVRPGSYDLFIYAGPPAGQTLRRYYIDRARVEVRDRDVEGVSLQIQKGTEIQGKVVGQGATALPMDKIKINLRSQDTMPDAFAIIVGAILWTLPGISRRQTFHQPAIHCKLPDCPKRPMLRTFDKSEPPFSTLGSCWGVNPRYRWRLS